MKQAKSLIMGMLAVSTASALANWVITAPESRTGTPGNAGMTTLTYNPDISGVTIASANFLDPAQVSPALVCFGRPGGDHGQRITSYAYVTGAVALAATPPPAAGATGDFAAAALAPGFQVNFGLAADIGGAPDSTPDSAALAALQPAQTMAGATLLGFAGVIFAGRLRLKPPAGRREPPVEP